LETFVKAYGCHAGFSGCPIFLRMHGKDISIPKGTEVTAYVNGDMKLDIGKFQPSAATQQPASETAMSSSNSTSAKLQMESNPSDADIEVDGSFVGNTPSDVQVADGEHTIAVKKAGFKDWERKMKVSAEAAYI
jgi:activator of HSP90 ATPase